MGASEAPAAVSPSLHGFCTACAASLGAAFANPYFDRFSIPVL